MGESKGGNSLSGSRVRNFRQFVGVGLFASVLVVVAFLGWVELTSSFDTKPVYLIPVIFGAVVGLVLLIRVPGNNIGVLLLVATLAMTGLGAGDVVMAWGLENGYLTLSIVASLVNDTSWAALMVSVFILLPIWFPDGITINRWSQWVARSAIVLASLGTAGFWFAEQVCVSWPGEKCLRYEPNPWGIPNWDGTLLEPLLLVALLLAIPAMVSAIIRWRRSTGVTRQQLKWFVFAASTSILVVLVTLIWTPPQRMADIVTVFLFSGLWLSIGFAVLRYRLYDLDRIISRTITYTAMVALLGLLYFGMVTLITAVLPAQSTLAVAASTLAAAAAFNPARKRIQHWVDRRFNRTAYQAESITEEFSAKLRESLTVEELALRLEQTATESLQPEAAGVWINEAHSPQPRT